MNDSANPPLFRVNEKIGSNKGLFPYRVLANPDTCIHNNEPAYLLECLNPTVKTPPFHRSQVDVEANWKSLES